MMRSLGTEPALGDEFLKGILVGARCLCAPVTETRIVFPRVRFQIQLCDLPLYYLLFQKDALFQQNITILWH